MVHRPGSIRKIEIYKKFTRRYLEYSRSVFEVYKNRVSGILAQYKAAIHKNENLQDIEKFNYLKSLLTDSVATAISGLPLTPENYRKAVEILKERFGKKEILISAHTNRLLNLEQVRNTNDIFALRKLYDEINVQIRSLESLGVNSISYGLLLLPILYKCIPCNYVLQFNREQNGKEESNVADLLNFLRNEIEAREKTLNATSVDFKNSKLYENKENKISQSILIR
ncbi:reverse transcriptase [Caerostris extrusa]|uniref:Reverse transcriptase n=1 Tax=Caerostris extrusa TaxID=172846 RepID=A0AAV4NTF4_CAEEX|nr:reverse transcriptase [Caerostris extrusa]